MQQRIEYVRRTDFSKFLFKLGHHDTKYINSVLVDLVRSVFPLNRHMPVILLFVLLVLFQEHIQPTRANYSVALPLPVRSSHLSYWLPQINGTANATSHDAPFTTASDLSQVCPFTESNTPKRHDPFCCSRRESCVSLSVSMVASTASSDQLPTYLRTKIRLRVASPLRTSRIE